MEIYSTLRNCSSLLLDAVRLNLHLFSPVLRHSCFLLRGPFYFSPTPSSPYSTLLLMPTSSPNGFLKNPSRVCIPSCFNTNS